MTRDPHGQEILTDGAERIPGLSQAFGAGIRAQWIATRREGALLVTGATGGERSDLTDWLIGAILCEAQVEVRPCGTCWSCHQFASGRHPDLHFLQSASGRIGVDEIRELADELTLTSHRGGRKVGWLPQAERMTDAAANAFLKTLEEPPGPTVFILETGRPLGLKATIRSRCEKLRIRTLHTVPTADPAGGGDVPSEARRALIADYARLLDGEIEPIDLEKYRDVSSLAEVAHEWSLWFASAARSRLGWPSLPDPPEPLRIRLEHLTLGNLIPLYTQARETERLARTSANEKLAREALWINIFLEVGHDGRGRKNT